MDDVWDVFAPIYRGDERHAGPHDLVRVAGDADDAKVCLRREVLDYTCCERD